MKQNYQSNTLFLLLIAILCITSLKPSFAQNAGVPFGFSMMNERNHPQLKWQVAETRHFLIHYPEHLSGIEVQAASVAEATYAALAANLDVTFDYKIRIFLSDEDEIVNGFAVPLNRAYTNIWVNLNDVARAWSGPEKWLRTVIAHELAHIFHFEAVKSNIPLVGVLGTAPALPDPWTEGIAQYYTEPWHALRGDAILRTSVYDGHPSFRDGTSIRNRQLMYAAGNSQLRYFAWAYGDSLIPEILAHRKRFGPFRTHNFGNSFKEITGKSFAEFEDEWRRHVSIYYHTLAGQMERSDSLNAESIDIPGLFKSAVRYSPDKSMKAVVAMRSADEPYFELSVVHESDGRVKVLDRGDIRGDITWHPDAHHLVYVANTRGQYGSLVNDLFKVNALSGRKSRLTNTMRASSPSYAPDGTLYFVKNENGTGNIFILNESTGETRRITSYTGDTQIGKIDVHPRGTHVAYALFEDNGSRVIIVRDVQSGNVIRHTNPNTDDRDPVWSYDGISLAFTSMRDFVPNAFKIPPFNPDADQIRLTNLFTGANLQQWIETDSEDEMGRLILISTDSKRSNKVYSVDAGRDVYQSEVSVNESYMQWLTHQPPHVIPEVVESDRTLIVNRSTYSSWRNISHVSTIPVPFYNDPGNYGLGLISLFTEPLSKHQITAAGFLSLPDYEDNSVAFLNYTNNQFRPSWGLNAYHNSFTGRLYDRDVLVTTNTGGFLLMSLPRDWIHSPFVNTTIFTRLRYDYTNADRSWVPTITEPNLGQPQSGWQSDIQLGLRISRQLPYRRNIIHPLNGWGVETKVTLATDQLGGETEFVRPDLKTYVILPSFGKSRFFVYGRAIAQWGDSFVQDYIGFSRFDDPQFGASVPGLDFLYGDAERVRGYSAYQTGNRMLFSTVEYRIPLYLDLRTQVLGLVSLGTTTLSLFLDAGFVWDDDLVPGSDATGRAGTGAEIKNVLNIFGIPFVHSLGYAQPVNDFFGSRNQEIYYRVKAVVPF